jgi:hypothetical protein
MMPTALMNVLQAITGIIAGALIGAGFGLLQDAARRRNERLQSSGKLKSGWAVMPGAGRRVAYLLLALVLVQLVCPLLFRDGIQWWVSAGVAGGYGLILYLHLRRRLSGTK